MVKGNKLIDDHVQISINIVRLKSHGKTFEVAVDPDKAVSYKEGDAIPLEEIAKAQRIFSDVKKGLPATTSDIEEVFETSEFQKIFAYMLAKGEIQLTQEYRKNLRERKYNRLIHIIHQNAINPQTNLPHPENRIRAALEETKFRLNDFKKAKDQVAQAVKLLRPIIPISMHQTILQVLIPASSAGKVQGILRNATKILDEQWFSDGSFQARIEIPAGMQTILAQQLNNATHGGCTIEVEKQKNT